MPIIKSAKKRVKVANKAAIRNSKTKRSLKTSLKAFALKPNAKTHATAQSKIDTAVKKGLMHKNKASRLKKKAAQTAKANHVKLSTTKVVAKKAVPKKTVKKAVKKTTKVSKKA